MGRVISSSRSARWRGCATGSARRRPPAPICSPSPAAIRARSRRSTRGAARARSRQLRRPARTSSPRTGRRSSGSTRSRWRWSSATRASGSTATACSCSTRPIVDRATGAARRGRAAQCRARPSLVRRGRGRVRAEALVRIDSRPAPLPCGLLLLGQRGAQSLDAPPRRRIVAVPRPQPRGYDPAVGDDRADDELIEGHPARALAARWHAISPHDRRRSPHTVRAYVATAHRFIDFLGRHRGEEIGRFGLLNLAAADLRAFLAERRGDGLGPSSAAREMSAVRAFLTFAAEDAGNVAATAAHARAQAAANPAAPGQPGRRHGAGRGSRRRRAPTGSARATLAILLLLYGSGLRVAEALSLTARVLPLGRALRVTGKRGKTRVVPVVRAVREAIAAYVAACPWPLAGDAPLFVGVARRAAQCRPRAARGARGAAPARPARQPDPARAAPQLRDAFAGGRRRLALAAGIARPRQPVVDPDLHRRSMPRGCSTSIATPIRGLDRASRRLQADLS